MNKRLTSILMLALSATLSWAVPARRGPIAVSQPDGYELMICLHGDERHHWTTTTDGYRIAEASDGCYYYQKQNADGTCQASRRKARNEADRSCCDRRFLKRHGVTGKPGQTPDGHE